MNIDVITWILEIIEDVLEGMQFQFNWMQKIYRVMAKVSIPIKSNVIPENQRKINS